jgi:hypothetical protein
MTIASKPARTSQEILTLMIQRAKNLHGIAQKEIGLTLADKAFNVVSNWKKEGLKGIPIDQIIPFAEITRMSNEETVDLIVTRLDEEDGSQVTIDVKALIKVFSYLSEPSTDEMVMRNTLSAEKERINWRPEVFDKKVNVTRLRDCLAEIIQDDALDAGDEAN